MEESIEVSQDDKPDLLAAAFCARHGLPEPQRVKLAKLIEKSMREAMMNSHILQHETATTGNQDTRNKQTKTVACKNSKSEFEAWQQTIERELKDRRMPVKAPKINEVSERIAAGRPRDPAYVRLHQQALVRQRDQRNKLSQSAASVPKDPFALRSYALNTSTIQEITRPLETNYGEGLYERDRRKRRERSLQWVRLREEREQKELRNATFHPQINDRSKSLARSHSSARPESRLIEQGMIQRERLKRERSVQLDCDKIGCTFRPKINRRCPSP